MPNLTALSNNMTKAVALSNLVLVSPQRTVGYQPQNFPDAEGKPSTSTPPPSFLFNYEGDQVVELESDITDHFVENNQAIQDQIALRPEQFTTRGYIGELNNIPPSFLQPLQEAANRLNTIGAFVPQLSITAQIAYNQAFQAYQVTRNLTNTAVAAWSTINNFLDGSDGQNVISSGGISGVDTQAGTVKGPQNNQQTAFQLFYGYWRERRLFTIQTPWAVFQDMAIRKLKATQDAETRVITDFEVTFKMIRTAETLLSGDFLLSFSGRLNSQAAGPTNMGATKGVPGPSVAQGISSITR